MVPTALAATAAVTAVVIGARNKRLDEARTEREEQAGVFEDQEALFEE